MFRVDNAIDGVHAKQGCYICGNPNNLIDTETHIDYEGVLAVCRGCVHDMAQTAGFLVDVSVDEWDKLASRLAETEKERNSIERAFAEVYSEAQAATKRHKERQRKEALRASS